MTDPTRAAVPSRGRLATLAVLCCGATLVPAAPAQAEVRFRVEGAGFGHGVGLSQWGAYGFAKRGAGAREIATHYFRGTSLGKVKPSRSVRVLLGTEQAVGFSGAKRACGADLRPSRGYRAVISGPRVRLERPNGRRISSCGGNLVAKGVTGPIRIGGQGSYRGDLVVASKAGTGYVINEVEVDDYVRGVIANEMPSTWPRAALGAQAVAARSYGLATDSGGRLFDQYDDTRSQVYDGVAAETKRTNSIVSATARKVLEYRGEVIPAFFSSSSGGRTENVEFSFLGAEPKPYLRSVRDPYDDASPDHRWRETFSRAAMESKLSGLVEGRLRGIRVTRTGVSPRIVRARLIGTRGSTTVTGSDLQVRLGLRSTWATFERVG